MAEKIRLSINGVNAEVEKGKTVLEAAQQAGIYVPTICYHPDIKPFGGCRLCVVEIEGMRGFPIACATPTADGMVVRTDTESVKKLRRASLQFLLIEHPHACLTCERREHCGIYDICLRNVAVTDRCITCPKNKQCEFQRVVDYIGVEDMPYNPRDIPVDRRDPLIERDYNLCILCGRCVDMCADVRKIGIYSFINRGYASIVGTAFNRTLQESDCRFCGACVEVCPTGALMDTAAKYHPELDREAVFVPCYYACPAEINAPLYVYLIGQGFFQDALALNREKAPFPAVLGRVCIHPCEQACRRGDVNQPIAIRQLKRFVADLDTGEWKKYSIKLPPTGKKVAIVGSGPAGLTTGYYLAKLGHSVTVFEQLPVAGGMMRVGIPDYRLPPDILEGEINIIRESGVDIRLNSRIESLETLFEQGFDAVFVAVGAHRGMKMHIPGEDSPRVINGASFLQRINLGEEVDVGERVAVVGGGNVAIDSARTALRLGASEVSIIYRRTRAEMPASAEEVEATLDEKINMVFLTSPVNIEQRDGLLHLTCQRMELGEADASGRRKPVPLEGSYFTRQFSTVIAAVGQAPVVPGDFKLEMGRGGTINTGPITMATSRAGVWAGGDAVSGPASVIEAIAAGRRAAASIDRYLGGAGNIEEELTPIRRYNIECALIEGIVKQARVKMPELGLNDRVANFNEVELGLDRGGAVYEGRRCFQCGVRWQISAAPQPPVCEREASPA